MDDSSPLRGLPFEGDPPDPQVEPETFQLRFSRVQDGPSGGEIKKPGEHQQLAEGHRVQGGDDQSGGVSSVPAGAAGRQIPDLRLDGSEVGVGPEGLKILPELPGLGDEPFELLLIGQ